ncbi:hypothetical protein [Streptomyces sp. NBC_00470]|uniref:hypothetical protein n=1 Tax=Streptomyces sp. NBC_00470 TaxID=2975753 RepID=UPI0030E1F52C
MSVGGDGTACALLSPPPGEPSIEALSGDQGPLAALQLARIHRALSAYPKPGSVELGWLDSTADEVLAAHTEALHALGPSPQIAPRLLSSLHRWVTGLLADLRARVLELCPSVHSRLQALHGAFEPAALRWGLRLTGIAAPRPCTGHPAWELARLAFASQSVSPRNPRWQAHGIKMARQYRRSHPEGLPGAELAALGRIAALDLLTRPVVGTELAWRVRHEALTALLAKQSQIETALLRMLNGPA